jgi:hypothetical protein
MMKSILAALAVAALAAPASAAVVVTYEAPGVENTTSTGSFAVETFNSAPTGLNTSYSDTVGGVTFNYANVNVINANQYGGAGGIDQYPAAYGAGIYSGASSSYTLNVSSNAASNYFGAYFSAEDATNTLQFYNGSTLVYTFTPTILLSKIASNPAYFGNPDAPFLGQDGGQAYAYANIYFGGASYDKIVFSQPALNSGFETDNHTVGVYDTMSGTAVPEPATWAMMLMGIGAVGLMMRRRPLTALRAA